MILDLIVVPSVFFFSSFLQNTSHKIYFNNLVETTKTNFHVKIYQNSNADEKRKNLPVEKGLYSFDEII